MANEMKVDFIFRDEFNQRGIGWSESLFGVGFADAGAAYDSAFLLAEKRCMMLGRLVVCTHIRVSNVDVIGDSIIRRGPNPPPSGLYNPLLVVPPLTVADMGADFPWSALEVRMEATSLYRRAYWLSGNPDNFQLDEDLVPINGDWNNAFLAWRAALIAPAGRWCFKVRSKDSTAAPLKPIVGFNPLTFTFTAPAHGLQPNDKVSFRNGGIVPRLTGQYRVLAAPTVDTFTLQNFTQLIALDGNPKIQKVVTIYAGITEVIKNYYGSKKRGGVSFAARGRQRTQRS